VDATKLEDRASFLLTLLLTLVAYKITLRESLPRCNYLTFLDKVSPLTQLVS
jgi:hypothetical protein